MFAVSGTGINRRPGRGRPNAHYPVSTQLAGMIDRPLYRRRGAGHSRDGLLQNDKVRCPLFALPLVTGLDRSSELAAFMTNVRWRHAGLDFTGSRSEIRTALVVRLNFRDP